MQEDRKRKKEEEEGRKKGERALKMAEFEKWKTPPKANFVISKKTAASGEEVGVMMTLHINLVSSFK